MNTLAYLQNKFHFNPKQKIVDLDDFGRKDLASLFYEMGFNWGVEVGILLGKFSKEMCLRNPNLKLWGIDPFLAFPEYKDATTQEDWNANYERTIKKLIPYNCTIIREKSMDALKYFYDRSLDFVYIDGNHEFTSEANDIHEWSKKVKTDGIIAGHDFRKYKYTSFSHSFEVVTAYTNAYRLYPLFAIGRNTDHIRSWFWINR